MDVLESARSRLAEIAKQEFIAHTPEETKERVKQLNLLIKEIRGIKKELTHQVKLIRADYKGSMAKVASDNHLLSGLIFGRSMPGKIRADNKRNLAIQRDRVIAPYEELKIAADSILVQLEGFRDNDKEYLQELQEETKKMEVESSPSLDIFDRIEELGRMRDNKAITEDEFQTLKKALLAKT